MVGGTIQSESLMCLVKSWNARPTLLSSPQLKCSMNPTMVSMSDSGAVCCPMTNQPKHNGLS